MRNLMSAIALLLVLTIPAGAVQGSSGEVVITPHCKDLPLKHCFEIPFELFKEAVFVGRTLEAYLNQVKGPFILRVDPPDLAGPAVLTFTNVDFDTDWIAVLPPINGCIKYIATADGATVTVTMVGGELETRTYKKDTEVWVCGDKIHLPAEE